jgi:hypothetical protein
MRFQRVMRIAAPVNTALPWAVEYMPFRHGARICILVKLSEGQSFYSPGQRPGNRGRKKDDAL